MNDPAREDLRASINQWVSQALKESDPAGWFETLYAEAKENPERVPWALMKPNPYLLDWLVQPGKGKALVVGCGLGDDAQAISAKGFEVTAFDISPTAIAWCKKRFGQTQVNYLVADLFALDPSWRGAFEFVFSARSVQSLPLNVRSQAIRSIVAPVAPGGTLLMITQMRSEEEPDGPPWPLSEVELNQFRELGLTEINRQVCDSNDYPTVRIEYRLVEQSTQNSSH